MIPTPAEQFATITVKRRAASTFVSGRHVEGAVSTHSIVASVQPVRPDERLLLPEAMRTRAAVKFYTDDDVRGANEASNLLADRITYDGEDWEVFEVDNWTMPQLSHRKLLAWRLERK